MRDTEKTKIQFFYWKLLNFEHFHKLSNCIGFSLRQRCSKQYLVHKLRQHGRSCRGSERFTVQECDNNCTLWQWNASSRGSCDFSVQARPWLGCSQLNPLMHRLYVHNPDLSYQELSAENRSEQHEIHQEWSHWDLFSASLSAKWKAAIKGHKPVFAPISTFSSVLNSLQIFTTIISAIPLGSLSGTTMGIIEHLLRTKLWSEARCPQNKKRRVAAEMGGHLGIAVTSVFSSRTAWKPEL